MTVTSRALSEGMELAGASGRKYLLVGALGARPGLAPNVWTAVDADTHSEIFIVKQPNAYDAYGWPEFKQEMVMHELFKDCDHIRRQVDKIAPGSVSPLPAVVLEAFEGTVWSARASRPFTSNELKSVMKSSLLGLGEIHAKGMVYAGLSPPSASSTRLLTCGRSEDGEHCPQRLPRQARGWRQQARREDQ